QRSGGGGVEHTEGLPETVDNANLREPRRRLTINLEPNHPVVSLDRGGEADGGRIWGALGRPLSEAGRWGDRGGAVPQVQQRAGKGGVLVVGERGYVRTAQRLTSRGLHAA